MKNEIKDYMMIIGAKILSNEWMEITMIPLTTVKKKTPNLMDLTSGTLESLINEMQGTKQYESKHVILLTTWHNMKLRIGSHITLQIDEGEI